MTGQLKGMGRLFWKFFFFIWLAQAIGMVGIGTAFWLEHRAREAQSFHAGAAGQPPACPPDGRFGGLPPRGAPSGIGPHGPGDIGRPPPSPQNDRRPGFIPMEPLIANILVTLLCSILLAWYFSKPIRSLRAAFDAAADGKLDTRLGPTMGKRRDELADLGRDFDRMASQLQVLMDSQRHLLHDVSHELRSPLARLQAAIGLARQSPEKLEATMDRIELESTRIDQLVGELLTLSRLEVGVMGSLQEDVDMDELLADIMADANFEAEVQEREMDFRGDCNAVVRGRAELLCRAIENVVRNAIKHTPKDGAVTVRVEHDVQQRVLKLFVLDQGPGVPEADLDKIFEPFFRSHASSGTDGHGLGLAIAQRVVHAHGGRIAASNRPGGGLCVQIDLPVSKSSLPGFTAA